MRNFKWIALTGLLSVGLLNACQNNAENNTSEGNSGKIAPSAGDETRYNLSEQQKMSMQGDTIKVDSTKSDTIN
ncbi:hypothetical protein KO02_10750 [Sphingobacterium sp. ML3W]|uniref:hypothetical protein n=1 Tax=Sphingobacterium sp. ML3W TaxID=1538644 RepID=UPI0004F8BE03|nr:hypothetical protein [Sphingobacterium sp. ML3W]AIM37115.1 hypothetical protein KO02_10750 [Sphingobacterium sp. ML3W]